MSTIDWSNPEHWSPRQRPCVHCHAPTNLRDGAGRPSHKVCAERVIDVLRAQRKEAS